MTFHAGVTSKFKVMHQHGLVAELPPLHPVIFDFFCFFLCLISMFTHHWRGSLGPTDINSRGQRSFGAKFIEAIVLLLSLYNYVFLHKYNDSGRTKRHNETFRSIRPAEVYGGHRQLRRLDQKLYRYARTDDV